MIGAAFLFPGQGSVFARMGADIAARWPEANATYARISELCGADISALSFAPDVRPLLAVEAAHIAIFTHSLAVQSVVGRHAKPDYIAGHSLGLLAAATAAQSLSEEDAVRLVKRRGELLRDACRLTAGGMVAVRGAPLPVVRDLVEQVGRDHVVALANYNGAREFALSGDLPGLQAAVAALKGQGAACRRLEVQGAFHSPLMLSAAGAFAAEVANVPVRAPICPIISSCTGRLLENAEAVAHELATHVLRPVRWDQVLRRLTRLGVTRWVEIGPGKVLTSFSLQWDRRVQARATTSAAALARTCEDLNGDPLELADAS